MDIPKDKNYPADAVQCDGCGGHGCEHCGDKGWQHKGHSWGRICFRRNCNKPTPPSRVAVFCSDACAAAFK